MNTPGKDMAARRVISYEVIAFSAIILLIWLNEVIDLPHRLLGAEATPVNWRESMFESVTITLLAAVILHYTRVVFRRMKYLEGVLPVCASCKKIRDENNNWQPIESYIHAHSDADFSHSICPECAARLYPDFNPYTREK